MLGLFNFKVIPINFEWVAIIIVVVQSSSLGEQLSDVVG